MNVYSLFDTFSQQQQIFKMHWIKWPIFNFKVNSGVFCSVFFHFIIWMCILQQNNTIALGKANIWATKTIPLCTIKQYKTILTTIYLCYLQGVFVHIFCFSEIWITFDDLTLVIFQRRMMVSSNRRENRIEQVESSGCTKDKKAFAM